MEHRTRGADPIRPPHTLLASPRATALSPATLGRSPKSHTLTSWAASRASLQDGWEHGALNGIYSRARHDGAGARHELEETPSALPPPLLYPEPSSTVSPASPTLTCGISVSPASPTLTCGIPVLVLAQTSQAALEGVLLPQEVHSSTALLFRSQSQF
ncbi:uncharacterized protein ACOB8E_012950 [Sarcophilus harrisii]